MSGTIATADRSVPQSLAALLQIGKSKNLPLVMGVLNVTPDSFSDGGQFTDPQTAIAHARQMVADGADILDVGAESTRPYGGMQPISAQDEQSRLSLVLGAVIGLHRPVSIDTQKALTAAWAIKQGAAIVNDVWGLQGDADMARIVAKAATPVIVMHNRRSADPSIDIIADVLGFFARSLEIATQAGVARDKIVLDPGIGFGKTPEQSMSCIAHLSVFKRFGLPLLVGASRKRFISTVVPTQPQQRLAGSLASHLIAVENGAAIVRVHDVAETVQALRVAAAIRNAPKGVSQ